MFKISCFADEIAEKLDDQLQVMQELNIRFLSLRNADGKAVLDFTPAELKQIRQKLDDAGAGVSSIGSPIGKSPITDASGAYLEQTRRAIEAAHALDSKFIRVFSFYMEKDSLDANRSEVLDRLNRMTDLAEAGDVTLILENEAGIYGESSARCRDLLAGVNRPRFRACFDPSNYVAAGEDPFDQSLPNVKDYVAYFHIKDSRHSDGMIVPAGEGDGQVSQVLTALADRELFTTLEPHLWKAYANRGFSGPERFRVAYEALTGLLKKAGISYQ